MLTSFALIFLVGLSLGHILKRLHLPQLLGMLITGIVLGPYMLDFIDSSILNISTELRQIALIIILARAGLSLNLADLKRVGRPALLMCFLPACFEIAGTILLAPPLLGITVLDAAILGSVIAAVSPAVIVPRMLMLMENGYGKGKSIPQLIMAGASVDDVFVIVLFTAFTSLAAGENVSWTAFGKIPVAIILGIVVGVLFGFLLSCFWKRVHMRDSVKVIIFLSLSFLMVSFETIADDVVPFSGLLAVMATGVSLLKFYSSIAQRISVKFSKLWVAAEILLFVLVGASVDVSYALSAGFHVVCLIVLVLIFRMVGVFVSLIKTPLNMKERLFCMIAYLPKATVQAAIGGLPLAMGLPCGQLVLTAAVISILITAPVGAFGVDMLYKRLLTN